MRFDTRVSELVRIQFDALSPYTRHPYALVIPQTFTEGVLGEKLASVGVTVYRPLKVVDVKVNADDGNLADVVFDDGQVITTRYIIAADGAHSTVNHCAPFPMIALTDDILDSYRCRYRFRRPEERLRGRLRYTSTGCSSGCHL